MARSQILLKLVSLTVLAFLLSVRVLVRDMNSVQVNTTKPSSTIFDTNCSLRLPYQSEVRPVEEILEAQWVTELWTYLSHLDNKYVSLCIGDSAYMESVVNWLIAALVVVQPPLENVLVISLDVELHKLLHEHGIDSVYVNPWTVLRTNVKLATNFSHIWVTRLVMFRLINHWGYTVATYDSDAIPVKNPQSLFDGFGDSDLVGSRGVYPFDLHRKWKSATLCMGVVLFRASENTEQFWGLFSDVQQSLGKFDDQVIINNVFDRCGITWRPRTTDQSTEGTCGALELKVTLLPSSAVCRKCAERSVRYYVWHEMGSRTLEDKREAAERGGTWFLKQEMGESRLTGTDWLRFMSS